MRVFVAGATGVVGKRLIPILLAKGHQVTAIGRTPKQCTGLELMGATPIRADLFDRSSVQRGMGKQDAVINLATHLPSTSWGIFVPGAFRENDRIRSVASSLLVDTALSAEAEWFIQESFAPVYPDCRDQWIDEYTPILPARCNRSVADAERAAHRFTERGGKGIVLRFSAFYGSDAFQTRDIIRSVRYGWAPIPGNPDSYISSVSHRDAATAVAAVLGAEAGIYNVTDDEPLQRREYFDSLAAELDVPPPKLPPAWTARLFGSIGETLARSLRISNRKLRETCEWTPKYPSMRQGWHSVLKKLRKRDAVRGRSPQE